MSEVATAQRELDFVDSLCFADSNIERYPEIFPPIDRNHPDLARERVIDLPSINGLPRMIIISPSTSAPAYNITTKSVYYALAMIWTKEGMPTKKWKVSLSRIAKEMGRSRGQKVLTEIKSHLKTLKVTDINFVQCYRLKDTDGEMEVPEKYTTILSEYEPITRVDKHGKMIGGGVTVQFHEDVLKNLNDGNVIPTNVKTLMSITCPVSTFVYMKMDNILTSKMNLKTGEATNEATIDNLLKMMCLYGDEKYKYPSWKKQLADRIVRHLDGKELSMEGVKMYVSVSLTAAAAKSGGERPEYKLKFAARGKPKPKLTNVNSNDLADQLLQEMLTVCGQIQDPVKTVRTLNNVSKIYPAVTIYRAVGEAREEITIAESQGKKIDNKPGFLHAKIKAIHRDQIAVAASPKPVPALPA